MALKIFIFLILIKYTLCINMMPYVNFFKNSPMFVLFASDCRQSQDDSNEFLRYAANEVQSSGLTISKTKYGLLRPLVNKNLMAFVLISNGHFSEILTTINSTMKFLQDTRIVFILDRYSSYKDVVKLFNWCWINGMLNVLITVEEPSRSVRLYTYSPFPKITIQSVSFNTFHMELSVIFPDKTKDLYKFPIRTILKYEHPRSYNYTNHKGQEIIGGYVAKLLFAYIEKHNGSVRFIKYGSSEIYGRQLLVRYFQTDLIDIALTLLLENLGGQHILQTRPVNYFKTCIMVPKSKQGLYAYLFLPFKGNVWLLLLFAIIFISTAEFICEIVQHNKFDYGRAFCNVILGLIYQAVDHKNYNSRGFIAIHGQLMFLGFIITNLFLTNMSSYLTTPIYNDQIETYDQIRKAGIKIMIETYVFNDMIQYQYISPQWADLFYKVDGIKYMSHINSLNNSYGYIMSEDRIKIVKLLQRLLKKTFFHFQKATMLEWMPGISVKDNSPFLSSLNKFISDAKSAGLLQKWNADIIPDSIEGGIIKWPEIRSNQFVPLSLKHLELTLICLLFGLGISTLCFIFECLISFMQKSNKKM